jgi:D-3-phosphoglycerate dehydrogenase/C-terminal binding protein
MVQVDKTADWRPDAQASLSVVVLDAPGGGYVECPDLEDQILGAHARTRLELVSPADRDRLLALDAEYVILWHRVSLDAEFFEQAKTCRAVVCASVGYDHVDLAAAAANGVPVYHIPHYGTDEVADHTVALALALVRDLPGLQRHTRDGGWDWRAIGNARRLRGKTWGLIGFGRIGTAVGQRARAFGMEVAFYDPYNHPGIEKAFGFERHLSLDSLLGAADIVSVHVPLNAGTANLLGAAELRLLKPDAVLVNTARGGLIDLDALPDALAEGRPARLGLDVVAGEPDVPEWMREDPRVLLTPHAAFYSVESLIELRSRAAEAVLQLITGQPVTSAFVAR